MDKLCCEHLTINDLDQDLVVVRDSIARELGLKPEDLPINIGARCAECNKAIGGASHSSHVPANNSTKKGEAIDISCTDSRIRFDVVYKLLLRGFVRIEWGTSTWIHVDKGQEIDGFKQRVMFSA